MATRIALGGGRGAIVRQLLTESVVLAALGGAAGMLLGYVGFARSRRCWKTRSASPAGIGLDARVLAITSLIALGTSVAFGFVPALQATGVDLRATLVESGSGSIAGARAQLAAPRCSSSLRWRSVSSCSSAPGC